MSEMMLTEKLKACDWVPREVQSASFARSGASQVVEMGSPFWEISLRYENLTDADARIATAWLARRRGRLIPFWAFRPSRRTLLADPKANNVGADPSNYSAAAKSFDIDTTAASVGDMVSYIDQYSRNFVGEITEVVSQGGSSATVKTFPPAPQPHATPAGRWFEAFGAFELDPESVNFTDPVDGRRNLSFTARQVIG